MKRREFITLLGGVTATWPVVARAQPRKLPTIGFLGAATPLAWGHWVTAFTQRLHELGWIEDRTVAIEYRWAEGRNERYREIAEEFVRLKVSVIVTAGAAVPAAMQATSSIPIVFGLAGSPIGEGFVTSLSRPGGNVTGLSLQTPDIAAKRLQLMRELLPAMRRLAIMFNTGHIGAVEEMREIRAAAGILDKEVVDLEIRGAADVATAFEGLKDRADALYVCTEPLMHGSRIRINILAAAARLPTMFSNRDYVDSGGLISYGTISTDLWRRAGDYVDKILRGARPGDLPIEQPTKFNLVINLTTAKALGLTIPPTLLARADEVIE